VISDCLNTGITGQNLTWGTDINVSFYVLCRTGTAMGWFTNKGVLTNI
jgi:hypothetical protein